MKKIILGLMLGLLSFGASFQASASARLDSMTSDSREVDDIDLIWLYPNKVLDYKNTVDFRLAPNGDFGEGVSEWGGVITEVSPDLGVWGVYVNRPGFEASPLAGTVEGILPTILTGIQRPIGNFPLFIDENSAVDAFWAKDLDGAGLGLRFNYASEFPEITTFSLSAGLGFSNVGPFDELNIHLDYGWSYSEDVLDVRVHNISTWKAGVLAASALDKDSSLRFFLDGESNQANLDSLTEPVAFNLPSLGLDLGLSANRKINGGKGLVLTGLIFDYMNINAPDGITEGTTIPPFTIDTWYLVWNASLEYRVYDWLTLRSGLAKALVARAYQTEAIPEPTYFDVADDPVVFNLGFGINWQNFILDANVDATSLENSINNIQPGNGLFFTSGDPIAQVVSADLKYKF